MSTFGGKIKEIPYISIDKFDGENLYSEVYFLSHCHSDHMIGLNYDFGNHLINNNRFIYASEISCIILKRTYPNYINNLKELSIYVPETINENLSVTIIPAGHCPGSVMFLFVTDSKRILYTGDYRINKNDIRKNKQFYNGFNQVLTIDKIYLDTTFFSKSYLRFPKRTESTKEICRLIENHLTHDRNMVHISGGAKYAYEYVFSEIYKRFKLPVHVGEIDYNFYKLIPELDFCVTMDGSKTPIHYNCLAYKKACHFTLDTFLLKLNITAWRWNNDSLENGISYYDPYKEIYNVCFSTHASLEEGMELITFLKPKEIEICVKHKSAEVNEEMSSILNKVLNEMHPPKMILGKQQLFKTNLKVKRKKHREKSDSKNSSILGSPTPGKRLPYPISDSEMTRKLPTNFETTDLSGKMENNSPVASTSVHDDYQFAIAKSHNLSLDQTERNSKSQSDNVLMSIIEGNHYIVGNNITDVEGTGEEDGEEHLSIKNSEENVILRLINSEEHKINSRTISSSPDILQSQNVLLDILDLDSTIR